MAALPCEHCRQRLLPALYFIAKVMAAAGAVYHRKGDGCWWRCTAKAAMAALASRLLPVVVLALRAW
jgi:hypothetical protein